MKTLVTGSHGFMGRFIVEQLIARGHEVVHYDINARYGPDSWGASTLDFDSLVAAMDKCDAVFHLSGVLGTTELYDEGVLSIRENIEATHLVLEAAITTSRPRVFFPTKPNDWENMYTLTKRSAEELVRLFTRSYQLQASIIRWRNAYGPGQALYPVRKAVPTMIVQALAGADVEVYGSGEQAVDLEFAPDLAEVTVEYTLSAEASDLPVDSGVSQRITVNELAERVIRHARSTSRVVHLPMRQGEGTELLAPPSSPTAADLTGSPGNITTIDKGLADTVTYYAAIPEATRRSILELRQRPLETSRELMLQCRGVIVVLGAPNDEYGNLSAVALSRVRLAAKLVNERVGWKILPTGGFGDHFNMTALPAWRHATKQLLALGVPREQIIAGLNSQNTAEDAALTVAFIKKHPRAALTVVTSDFHVERARFWFGHLMADREIEFVASTAATIGADVHADLRRREWRALEKLQDGLTVLLGPDHSSPN